MKRAYTIAGILLIIIAVAFLLFFQSVTKKSGAIKNNLKKVEVFKNSAPKADPFGKLTDSVKPSNTPPNNTSDKTAVNTNDIEIPYELKQVHNLSVSGFDLDKMGKRFIWLESNSGQTYGKDSLKSSVVNIAKNPKADVFEAWFADTFVLREYVNNDFTPSYDIVTNKNELIKLNGDIERCFLGLQESVLCIVKNQDDVGFLRIDVQKGENTLLYTSSLSKWYLQDTENGVFAMQLPSENKESAIVQIKNGNAKIIEKGYALNGKVSKDGKFLIYSKKTKGGYKSYLKYLENGVLYELPFQTVYDKCVFQSQKLYCAGFLDSQFSLDEYMLNGSKYNDEFFVVNINDINAEKIKISNDKQGNFDIKNPTATEGYLGFINKTDSKPWVITLPKDTQNDVKNDNI